MNEEKSCPICGLKMTWLAFQLWQCQCGHTERGAKDAAEENEDEPERDLRWGVEKDGRFREQKQPYRGMKET
jgi:hypothetical protein